MTINLDGRITVITGASSGIGAATARAAAKAGAHTVLAARNPDKLDDLATSISKAGGSTDTHVTDVTDPASVKKLIATTIATHGRIDHVVNNAGLMLFSRWTDGAIDEWNTMIDTNIRGYLNVINAVLPYMVERGSGHILNMSSVAGIRVGDASGVYSATKFFIRGITDSLRQEVGIRHNIQVSMISPGVIDTGWADKVTNNDGRDIAQDLNTQAIQPEHVAEAVVYALNQPPEVTVNDIVIHPTSQTW